MRFAPFRILLTASLLAGALLSCKPESERTPKQFDVTLSNTELNALQTVVAVNVQCDLNWKVELSDPSWGQVDILSYSEGIGGTCQVTLEVNLSKTARENTIIVRAGKEEVRETFTQGGIDSFFTPGALQLSGTQTDTVSFYAPTAWSAALSAGEDWLQLDSKQGKSGASFLTCAARDANEQVGPREGVISVTLGEYTLDIPVIQDQTDVVFADGSQLSLNYHQQEFTVLTRYNVEYGIEISDRWITHLETKDPLHTSAEVFFVTENESADERTATIRFSDPDHPETGITIQVSQHGVDPILLVSEPGLYGLDGFNYQKGAEGWNQSASRISADGSFRYRLFNASTLSVFTLEGVRLDSPRDSECMLYLQRQDKGQVTQSLGFLVTVLEIRDGMLWLKASDETYFILQ